MLQNRLDELGWYQFEDFVQTLLKAAIGPGVEAWGGRGDFGRDCYCPSALNFPDRAVPSDGPFLFQAKFVSGANATGATFFPALKGAVNAEVARIRARQETGQWSAVRQYVLVTNCPIQASQRKEIESILILPIPDASVHILSGKDLSGLAADHPNVRKAFPQLLGLGDLEQLITNATNKELLERSRAALQAASALAPVFVPTVAYDKAWTVLGRHGFAVLEGPPEMGKTAIAQTIGALKYADGWEVYECRHPEDVFKSFDEARQQLFIADDAFGRTEYDPSLGKQWERDLDKLLRRVDNRHWLIWTSRKHILERALHSLDLQGMARDFPDPSAVLVDASALTNSEKTQILFRHARHTDLVEDLKSIIRANGRPIVKHEHFTPERIRRFVTNALPRIRSTNIEQPPSAVTVRQAIIDEIANPTEGMKKSFASLPTPHKIFLFALVEGENGSAQDFTTAFNRISQTEAQQPPKDTVAEELSHSFIRVNPADENGDMHYEWMHPSVRDLVIDELSVYAPSRRRFLQDGSLEVVNLALSEEGGSLGERTRPLLRSIEDWQELERSCQILVSGLKRWRLQKLFDILLEVDKERLGTDRDHFERLAKLVCEAAIKRWDNDPQVQSIELYEAVAKLTTRISPLPPLPNPARLWESALAETSEALYHELELEGMRSLTTLLRVARILTMFEPRFLLQVEFPEKYLTLINEVEDSYANNIPSDSNDLDDATSIARAAVEEFQLSKSIPAFESACEMLLPKYERALQKLYEAARISDPDDDEYQPDRETDPFPDSMIDLVLADL